MLMRRDLENLLFTLVRSFCGGCKGQQEGGTHAASLPGRAEVVINGVVPMNIVSSWISV